VGRHDRTREHAQRHRPAAHKEIVEILKQKDVIERMLAEGTVPTPSSPEEFTAYMKSDSRNGATS